jgi:predicted HD superfamily hydrolase involved in NAD metabolism
MREKIIRWLNQNVSEKRVKHILGVEEMSMQLAKQHGCDPQIAAQAGLMHDLAKFFPPQKLLKIAQEHHIPLDNITQKHPHLIHADVSAIIAKTEFAVDNSLILEAIGNHTLGQPEMSKLSCIVFIADKIEITRGDTPQLKEMRKVSQENLYKGLTMVCDYSLSYLLEYNQLIHPRTILTRNWALSSQN